MHGADEPEPLEKVSSETDPEVLARLNKDDRRRPIPRSITALASVPGTDLVVSGSWDGWIRVWKLSDDKRTIALQSVVGKVDAWKETSAANGHSNGDSREAGPATGSPGPIKSVINSIDVFERRKEIQNEFGGKKEGETVGLCIVAGIGKEMRLGRWNKLPEGRNGALVLEVPVIDNKKIKET